jgi:hypothetical protein
MAAAVAILDALRKNHWLKRTNNFRLRLLLNPINKRNQRNDKMIKRKQILNTQITDKSGLKLANRDYILP